MSRDVVLAMIKALPGVKEDGSSLLIDESWEVTMHVGRSGSVLSIQQLTRITLHSEFLVAETHKGQRVIMLVEEIRGFSAEPSSVDRTRGRKTGFV